MDSYRPQSPDLSSYAPQSPDLSAFHPPQSPDLPAPQFGGGYHPQHQQPQFGSTYGNNAYPYTGAPTSVPNYSQYLDQPPYAMPQSGTFKNEHDDHAPTMPQIPQKRSRKNHQNLPSLDANGQPFKMEHSQLTAPLEGMTTKPHVDPTLGVQLKTSFPVARIKRIMQADEDIGKVAQVTPHVVSRALELFMIRLISASAAQARAAQGTGTGGGGGGKGPRRILAQHLKKAVQEDETFDFLAEIVGKVPDAPSKAKREMGSDSEEGASGGAGKKKKGKRRKDSGDDF